MATRKKSENAQERVEQVEVSGEGAPAKPATKRATATKKTGTTKAKKAAADSVNSSVEQEAIAQRAWEIWQMEGCPEGREVEHWLQAEKELGGV